MRLTFSLLFFIFLSSNLWAKNFPKFKLKDIDNNIWTEDSLLGKKSIIVLFHLGCPGAMSLLNDLDSLKNDNPELQVFAFAENTQEQLKLFFGNEKNDWTTIREYFKTKEKLNYPILAECEEPYKENGEVVITTQCRVISKQVHSKNSPTILLIDDQGEILKNYKKGYIAFSPIENRMNWLKAFIK